MPIYEYRCKDCQELFDALRSMSKADDPIACQNCKSLNTRRQISAAYAHSGGRVIAGGGNSSSCVSCSGGSCSSCGH